MRLFLAIPIPKDTRAALKNIGGRLMAGAVSGNVVPEDNFHVTLHFIGESSAVYDAALSMDEAVRGIRAHKLKLNEYGSFHKGATGFVSLTGDVGELNKLHEALISQLGKRGFPLAGGYKKFSPHITLARKLELISGFDTSGLMNDIGPSSVFVADRLTLFESTNVNGRMVYTPVHISKIGI